MAPNLLTLTREKREFAMKGFLMPATTLSVKRVAFTILCCGLLMLFAAPAWADQCSGALPVGTATGCGAIITVTSVDGSHNANAFTVTKPVGGNGNPYDGTEDSLIGIQNSSGTYLNSITLSSPNTTFGGLFGFDSDGPCMFNGSDCNGSTGYEGPSNTFSVPPGTPCGVESTCFTTGTVNFTGGGLLDGSSTWFALEGTPDSLTLTQQAVLTFAPGNNSSAVGTFNCSTSAIPCNDQGAHSMKFTVGNVGTGFSFVLTATEVDGDGICQSGVPGDPADPIDCRFVKFFGESTTNPPAVKVPHCYPYSSSTSTGTKHCVFYSVVGAPPFSSGFYSGGVLEKIAWNTVQSPPTGWVNSPRMYDDPSDDANSCNCYPVIPGFPYTPEDNQFVFDITKFFDPTPTGNVGTDPTSTGGPTKSFNDFVIAWPATIALVQQPINSDGSSVFNASRGVIPVKFTLTQDGVATCNLPPATISLNRLTGAGTAGSVDESVYLQAADTGSNFRTSGCQYTYNLQASALGVGTYKVGIVINSEVVGIAWFALK